MKTILRLVLLAFIVLLLSGCTGTIAAINALDSSIPRQPFPDDGIYVVTLQIEDKAHEVTKFRLENYYDGQASTRGNYWSKRFVGSPSSKRIRIETSHKQMGKFALVLMSTQYIKKQNYPDFRAYFAEIEGETFWESTEVPGLFFTRDEQGRMIEKCHLNYRMDIEYIPDKRSQ